MLKNSIELP